MLLTRRDLGDIGKAYAVLKNIQPMIGQVCLNEEGRAKFENILLKLEAYIYAN